MARHRPPGSRAAVVDGRAELIVPVESIRTADDQPLDFARLKRWLGRVDSYPGVPPAADTVSVVLDRFAFDVHFGDIAHTTDVHDGDEFAEAARAHGTVSVYVVEGLDPRRSTPEDLRTAAEAGNLLAGTAPSFEVDHLSD